MGSDGGIYGHSNKDFFFWRGLISLTITTSLRALGFPAGVPSIVPARSRKLLDGGHQAGRHNIY